ncbi:hypothetical protein P691DRAFT_536687 [Macrolepiota fuliginosa MF-IS2]|uniref:DUF6534 domain-containing protein n=1 Tax=Macrolepiota fuliginosa MF-IS2 TaxID=1400762 RepID=A0A9P5XHL7_9AGAR|nr:hypothetical protein P691DRAFT_536687 [Macrolepiota fuliginosa MF-IS2]
MHQFLRSAYVLKPQIPAIRPLLYHVSPASLSDSLNTRANRRALCGLFPRLVTVPRSSSVLHLTRDMESQVNVPTTFGALLLGGLYASLLSGAVALQVIIYFKMYGGDHTKIKALVLLIWVLDVLHTALVWAGLWNYLIGFFGQAHHIDIIPWAVSTTVAITGVLTFAVHCAQVSRRNWYLVVPITFLALCRLISAVATTAEMIKVGILSEFRSHFHWLFTLGLALSTIVDILITGSLFFLLKTSRTSDFNLNAVIDTLILYAFETGSLTTAGTIVSMICWLAMSNNLIFMGLHFVIAKCESHTHRCQFNFVSMGHTILRRHTTLSGPTS